MEVNEITSSSNALVKRIRLVHSRSGREKEGAFLVEGVKLFDEAVKNKIAIEAVVISKTFMDSDFSPDAVAGSVSKIAVVDDKLFSQLATTETPQGLIAVARLKRWKLDEVFSGVAPLVVVADRVQDPGNLGTMMRTALAFGATGMLITEGSVDAFNPKVVRSSAGAMFALPFIEDISIEDAVAECRGNGLKVFALSADGDMKLGEVDFRKPSAVLLGNEANGLSEDVEDAADHVVSIPMDVKSESLNVAIACAITLYEASSQR